MKYILLLSLLLILFGCKEAGQPTDKPVSDSLEREKEFTYKINFPDTVFLNKKNDGEILYESPYDTITDNFSESKQNRYVVFRTLSNNSYNFPKSLYNDSLQEYRIGAIDNRVIPFYELSFNTTGTYEIVGLINDQILIEPNTKYNSDKNNYRLIERDFPVSFKVVVIDSTRKNNTN